jgi:hypothetical protein
VHGERCRERTDARHHDPMRCVRSSQRASHRTFFGATRDEDRVDHFAPSQFLPITVVIERQMLPTFIESSAAVGSKPQWTMQSAHFGLPLL